MFNLNMYIDNYCERLDPGLFGEPFNTITNIAFLIVAYCLGKYLTTVEKNIGYSDRQSRYLINLVWFIGFGSLAFHIFSSLWAGIFDTLPIALLILSYSYLSLRRFFSINKYISVLAPLIIILMNLVLNKMGDVTNSAYFAALIGMILIGCIAFLCDKKRIFFGMLISVIVFTISLTFRIFDEILCLNIAIGTHWIWHILNALTLYIIIKLFIDHKLDH